MSNISTGPQSSKFFYRKTLQKALDELEWASRTEDESSSINFGKWVGIGAAKQIVQELAQKLKDEYEKEDENEEHY